MLGGWLFKEEPSHYSFADLERDRATVWDGVDNPMARLHLWKVKIGDRVLFYHTGKEKAVVGEMVITAGPEQASGLDDPKAVVVWVSPVKRWANPVTLKKIKAVPAFAQWDLVKNSRLSVMPVSGELWKKLEQMAQE